MHVLGGGVGCASGFRCLLPFSALPAEPMSESVNATLLHVVFSSALICASMHTSLEQYTVLQRIAGAVIEAGSTLFAEELAAAAEFVQLLPSKIDNLHYRGVEMD